MRKCGYSNPILGNSEVTQDLGGWLFGKGMIDFLFALIHLFAIYYGSGVMRRNVYSSAAFTGGSSSLESNFTWTGSSPSTILGIGKLETLGYQWWRPHPSAFPRFDTIPECDGQTDGRICRSMYSALLALPRCTNCLWLVCVSDKLHCVRKKVTP